MDLFSAGASQFLDRDFVPIQNGEISFIVYFKGAFLISTVDSNFPDSMPLVFSEIRTLRVTAVVAESRKREAGSTRIFTPACTVVGMTTFRRKRLNSA
jgi:hypothetical protein